MGRRFPSVNLPDRTDCHRPPGLFCSAMRLWIRLSSSKSVRLVRYATSKVGLNNRSLQSGQSRSSRDRAVPTQKETEWNPANSSGNSEKSIPEFFRDEKQKTSFSLSFIFSRLARLEMAAHPCAAGTSELIRGSSRKNVSR